MSDKTFQHIPVLLKESIEFLNVKENGTYVDCTLGGGGHAAAIVSSHLSPVAKVIGFDQDEEALAAAKTRLGDSITYIHDNFSGLKKHIKEPVDGFLFDLGVSSHQIDSASRGFSIREDGPLDMRMDQRQKLTAEVIINNYSQEELQKIFKEYSEERFAHRISKAICLKRDVNKIQTTHQLKEIIEQAIPTWKKRESVSRIFQSLRIFINKELDSLKAALNDAIELLKPGGRIVVLAYHSLEDRIVKQTFRSAKTADQLNILTKKPVRATEAEISSNPRSKSAKLRAGERR